MTKERIIEALNELFSDRSVPPETTMESMREIKEEIETLIDCLRSDGVS